MVAQLVEQRIENPRVGGSIPPRGTITCLLALRLVVGHRILIPVAEVRILEGQPFFSYKYIDERKLITKNTSTVC